MAILLFFVFNYAPEPFATGFVDRVDEGRVIVCFHQTVEFVFQPLRVGACVAGERTGERLDGAVGVDD